MTPTVFHSRRLLEALTNVAVGASLAAATSAAFTMIMGDGSGKIAFITGIPTLLVGLAWVALLRWPKTVRGTSFRVGWLLSVPLAMLNSAIAAGLLLATEQHGDGLIVRFLVGMLAGVTFGAMFWVPALLATLFCFGAPIARGQQLARQGVAGQERGDAFVGTTSGLVATLAMVVAVMTSTSHHRGGLWFVYALGAAAIAASVGVIALARRRERQRRDFVAAVEAGEVENFRVETVPEGKVLVRVVSQGEGYRVADLAEEFATLDHDGAVTRVAVSK